MKTPSRECSKANSVSPWSQENKSARGNMDQKRDAPTPYQIAYATLKRVILSDQFTQATEAQRHDAVEKLIEPHSLMRYSVQELLRERDRSINWEQVPGAFSSDGGLEYLKIRPRVDYTDEIDTDIMPHLDHRLSLLERFTSNNHSYELLVRDGEALLQKIWFSNTSIVEFWIVNNGSFIFVYSSPDGYLVVRSIGGHAGVDVAEFSYSHSHGEDMINIDLTELNLEQLKAFVAMKSRQYIKDAMEARQED